MSALNRLSTYGWRNRVPAGIKTPMAIAGSGSLALRIAAIGTGFLQAVLAARLLGVHDYGVYAFVNSVVAIGATLALLGMDLLSVRELARLKAIAAWEKTAGFSRASRIAVLVASILVGAAVAGFALLAPGFEYRRELALAGLLIPPASLILLFQAQARGLGGVICSQVPNSLIRPVIMLVVFAVLYFGAVHIVTFDAVLIVLLANFAALIFAVSVIRRVSPSDPVTGPTALEMRKHVAQATPFLAMSVTGILQFNGPTLLLVWLSGPVQAGLFQPIALLAPIMVVGLDTIAMPVAPQIAHLWEVGDVTRLRRTLRAATLAATGISVCVIAALLLMGPFILSAFGKEFAAVRLPLLWIAFAQLINAASGHVGLLLSMTSHQRDALRCQVIQLAMTLGPGAALIPALGTQGAAISLAVGIVIFNVSALIYARMRLGFDPALPGALADLVKPHSR
jgi:O-antigen/teichoic acid export membrane protein